MRYNLTLNDLHQRDRGWVGDGSKGRSTCSTCRKLRLDPWHQRVYQAPSGATPKHSARSSHQALSGVALRKKEKKREEMGAGGEEAKKIENKCWQRYREKLSLILCWWEYKLVQPLWKMIWRVL